MLWLLPSGLVVIVCHHCQTISLPWCLFKCLWSTGVAHDRLWKASVWLLGTVSHQEDFYIVVQSV